MERHQHLRRARQPQPPMPGRSSQQVRKPKASFRLVKPECGLSLALLGSAWIIVVVIALTAVSGLLSPNLSNTNQPRETASVRTTTPVAKVNDPSRLPLWLFGAIVLTCVAGSMLISTQANRPPRPRKSVKPKRLAPYVATKAMDSDFVGTSASPPAVAVPSFAMVPRTVQPVPPAAPFMAPTTLMQLAQKSSQAMGQPTGMSAAIAPEDAHPLDWGEASLADKLDIRKRRSMSSLL